MANDKKSSLLYVLKILQDCTDEKHLLTYSAISEKLYSIYGVEIERKTIANNIEVLSDYGYDIVKCRKNGLYLGTRDYEEGELLFLIDAIYSSKSMPSKYAKDLAERLSRTFSKFQRKKFNHLEKIDDGSKPDNKQIFYTVEILNDAIEQKKKVEFQYVSYGVDKSLKFRGDGKFYKINPYFMVNSRGKYYLVCNYDKYDTLANYKIENIANIKILDEETKPIESVCDNEKFSIKDYIKEHIYMMTGETIDAKIKIEKEEKVNDFIDWFGKDVFIMQNGGEIIASLKVNEESLIYWLMQYGENFELLEPLNTRIKLKEMLESVLKKYK